MNEATKEMLARLREADAALNALDQTCGPDPSGETITGAARMAYDALDKAVKKAVDDWNSNLEPGDQKVYHCEDADLCQHNCERWTANPPEHGVTRCDPCNGRAYWFLAAQPKVQVAA